MRLFLPQWPFATPPATHRSQSCQAERILPDGVSVERDRLQPHSRGRSIACRLRQTPDWLSESRAWLRAKDRPASCLLSRESAPGLKDRPCRRPPTALPQETRVQVRYALPSTRGI